jgi:ABC-type multidrug transport system fused ATPase/permease subunit
MKIHLELSPAKVTLFLMKIICCLLAINLLCIHLKYNLGYTRVINLIPLFDFDLEFNVPALYSATAIFFCAALLWFIASDEQKKQSSTRQVIFWKILSLVFIFLGIDELIAVHEYFSLISTALIGGLSQKTSNKLWVIPYCLAFLPLVLFLARSFMNLPVPTRRSFIVAGIVFVVGAVGMEVISGVYASLGSGRNFIYGLLYTAEELLEMVGIVLFIRALISHISAYSLQKTIDIHTRMPSNEKATVNTDFYSSVSAGTVSQLTTGIEQENRPVIDKKVLRK